MLRGQGKKPFANHGTNASLRANQTKRINLVSCLITPRQGFQKLLYVTPREGIILAWGYIGCGILFLARWPVIVQQFNQRLALSPTAIAQQSLPSFEAQMAAALFSYLIVLPLVIYAIAWLTYGCYRLIFRTASLDNLARPYHFRLIIFAVFCVTSPLVLMYNLLNQLITISVFKSVLMLIMATYVLYLYIYGFYSLHKYLGKKPPQPIMIKAKVKPMIVNPTKTDTTKPDDRS